MDIPIPHTPIESTVMVAGKPSHHVSMIGKNRRKVKDQAVVSLLTGRSPRARFA